MSTISVMRSRTIENRGGARDLQHARRNTGGPSARETVKLNERRNNRFERIPGSISSGASSCAPLRPIPCYPFCSHGSGNAHLNDQSTFHSRRFDLSSPKCYQRPRIPFAQKRAHCHRVNRLSCISHRSVSRFFATCRPRFLCSARRSLFLRAHGSPKWLELFLGVYYARCLVIGDATGKLMILRGKVGW